MKSRDLLSNECLEAGFVMGRACSTSVASTKARSAIDNRSQASAPFVQPAHMPLPSGGPSHPAMQPTRSKAHPVHPLRASEQNVFLFFSFSFFYCFSGLRFSSFFPHGFFLLDGGFFPPSSRDCPNTGGFDVLFDELDISRSLIEYDKKNMKLK